MYNLNLNLVDQSVCSRYKVITILTLMILLKKKVSDRGRSHGRKLSNSVLIESDKCNCHVFKYPEIGSSAKVEFSKEKSSTTCMLLISLFTLNRRKKKDRDMWKNLTGTRKLQWQVPVPNNHNNKVYCLRRYLQFTSRIIKNNCIFVWTVFLILWYIHNMRIWVYFKYVWIRLDQRRSIFLKYQARCFFFSNSRN